MLMLVRLERAQRGEEMKKILMRTLWVTMLGAMMTAAAQAASLTIPAGSTIAVRMADSIDSARSRPGEMFHATVDTALTVDGRVVLPVGAEAIGRLTAIEQPGRFRGRAAVTLELTAINFEGKSVAVLTSTYQEQGQARGKQTATFAGGGGLLGTLLGAVAGGPPGLLIGAGVGAASGAVVQVVRGPRPVRIPAESLMLFTLLSPITLDVQ
jgi:hypothetical protein